MSCLTCLESVRCNGGHWQESFKLKILVRSAGRVRPCLVSHRGVRNASPIRRSFQTCSCIASSSAAVRTRPLKYHSTCMKEPLLTSEIISRSAHVTLLRPVTIQCQAARQAKWSEHTPQPVPRGAWRLWRSHQQDLGVCPGGVDDAKVLSAARPTNVYVILIKL
jgi:hypothetical protein